MVRSAIRIGNPHSLESVSRVVNRYGAIEDETFSAIVKWLEKHSDYEYEIIMEMGNRTIRVRKVGGMIFKILDNQHDAQNTLNNLS